jgi:hypothetical protein
MAQKISLALVVDGEVKDEISIGTDYEGDVEDPDWEPEHGLYLCNIYQSHSDSYYYIGSDVHNMLTKAVDRKEINYA